MLTILSIISTIIIADSITGEDLSVSSGLVLI